MTMATHTKESIYLGLAYIQRFSPLPPQQAAYRGTMVLEKEMRTLPVDWQAPGRETPGLAWSFETSKHSPPSDEPPPRPHLLIVPPSMRLWGGAFSFVQLHCDSLLLLINISSCIIPNKKTTTQKQDKATRNKDPLEWCGAMIWAWAVLISWVSFSGYRCFIQNRVAQVRLTDCGHTQSAGRIKMVFSGVIKIGRGCSVWTSLFLRSELKLAEKRRTRSPTLLKTKFNWAQS